MSHVLIRQYIITFEATSVLLIVAAIAAMVLAHRRSLVTPPAAPDAGTTDGDGRAPAAEELEGEPVG
jgi:hypothetical protein